MSRPLRINFVNAIYHITSRGIKRLPIVQDDLDRQQWTRLLSIVATRRGWTVFAWVLMDNHFHALIQTPRPDLPEGMHDLNSGYASIFNSRDKKNRVGPVFQGRYKAILVEKDYHYWELTRYIHLNPVRAGMVEKPEEYRWGSCRFYFYPKKAPNWLEWREVLMMHGPDLKKARRAYREFLHDGMDQKLTSPLKESVAGTLLGSKEYVDKVTQLLRRKRPDREVPVSRLLGAVSLEEVEGAVCKAFGVRPESLRVRGKHGNEPRKVAMYVARRMTGSPVGTIGEHFGGVGAAAVCIAVKEVEKRRQEDLDLDGRIRQCEQEGMEREEGLTLSRGHKPF